MICDCEKSSPLTRGLGDHFRWATEEAGAKGGSCGSSMADRDCCVCTEPFSPAGDGRGSAVYGSLSRLRGEPPGRRAHRVEFGTGAKSANESGDFDGKVVAWNLCWDRRFIGRIRVSGCIVAVEMAPKFGCMVESASDMVSATSEFSWAAVDTRCRSLCTGAALTGPVFIAPTAGF